MPKAPKQKKEVAASRVKESNPGMVYVMSFAILTVLTALVIYLANMWFPEQVVLGTMSLSAPWAIFLSSVAVGVITTFTLPFLTEVERMRKSLLSPLEMMGIFLVVNFVSLWLLSRVAEVFGLGFSSWMVTLGVAVVLDVVQGIGMVTMGKMKE